MNARRLLLASTALAFLALPLFAQSGMFGAPRNGSTPSKGYGNANLTVECNVPGATVYIDGTVVGRQAPFQTSITRGVHTLRVSAPGYYDWTRQIDVRDDMRIRAMLLPMNSPQPTSYTLTITANINGAAVEVDGAYLNGGTPIRVTLAPGRHTIRVSAQGYGEWNGSVNLNRDMSVQARLQARSYTLRVLSNVEHARVRVDHAPNGTVPYRAEVPGGVYVITVTAPGYLPYTTTVTMDSDQTIRAVLRGGQATVELVIPEQYRNPFNHNPYAQIEWYVDGQRVHGRNDTSIEVGPGQHSIRIVSGGLSIERRFTLQAGETYRISPLIQLELQQ